MNCFIAKVPSNIALIKYWGKADENNQIPANDSISMTLKNSLTTTVATFAASETITLNGRILDRDHKVYRHLENLRQQLAHTETAPLSISSQNNFPMGCGIASSASGMGALTLAALGTWLDCASFADFEKKGLSRQRLAHLARMGSGSASRSFWGGYVLWERIDDACCLEPLFPENHWPLADVIIVIDESEKSVSSSQGHRSAWTSLLYPARLQGLPPRVHAIREFIRAKNFHALGALIEQDALDMHAVMMSSVPPLHYLTQETSEMLGWIREQRHLDNLPGYFTLDAGPNIHLLCEPENLSKVVNYLREHKPQYQLLIDETGNGPTIEKTSHAFITTEDSLAQSL